MFLFKKKAKKKKFFPEFFEELSLILWDVTYVYKNFLHWSFSRVIISVWSILLWIILALPFLAICIIVGLIDPIDWRVIIEFIVTGADPTHELLIAGIANHMYWLILMLILCLGTGMVFLFGSSYNLLLIAHLSLDYVKRKKLAYKKNLYFSKNHILTMMGLLSWNTVYFLAPFFIFAIILVVLYLAQRSGFFGFEFFSYLSFALTLVFIVIMSFVIYKILFGYVLLAKEKEAKIKSARSYLLKSIKDTSLRNYGKFVIILMMLFVVFTPFRTAEEYMDGKMIDLKNAFAYKSGLLDTMNSGEEKYWEYITREYEDTTSQELLNDIQTLSTLSILYFFVSYFLLNGLFILVVVSFYKRVIHKK